MSDMLNKKVSLGMFFNAMGSRFQKLLAGTLSDEEKLAAIQKEIDAQVQEMRVNARKIGASMRAIKDPDTKELEPLERLQHRRAQLVKLGGSMLNDPSKAAQLGQIQQEIQGLDGQIAAQERTYGTLEESYKLAMRNYQDALAAQQQVRENVPAMLQAIKAHKNALALRDKVKDGAKVDLTFVNEIEAELAGAQAEFRSEQELDADLDAASPWNVDKALAEMDAQTIDTSLMDEFRAAAGKP